MVATIHEELPLDLLAEARQIDGEIRALATRHNADEMRLACFLRDMKERKLAQALGFESVFDKLPPG